MTVTDLETLRQEMFRTATVVDEIEKRLAAARQNLQAARWEYHVQCERKALAEQREQQKQQAEIEAARKREIEAKRKELLDVLGSANYY